MRRGIPIYGKVLAWLAVNILVLSLLIFGFLHMQFRMSLDWMLAGSGGGRIEELSERLTRELTRCPRSSTPSLAEQVREVKGPHQGGQ